MKKLYKIKNLLAILSPPQATGYYGPPPSPHGGPESLYNKRKSKPPQGVGNLTQLRLKRTAFTGILFFGIVFLNSCVIPQQAISPPEAPFWWTNPHLDDVEFMYEKASAEGSSSEQAAREKAYENALSFLSKRIYAGVSSDINSVKLNSRHSFSEISIADEKTQKCGDGWQAWILIKYPQEKKKEFTERLSKSTANLKDIEKLSAGIKGVFKISICTSDKRTEYYEREKIWFSVLPEKNCHIAMFIHQSDGSSLLIYPNRYSQDTWIPADRVLTVPVPEKDKFEFLVSPPYGDDVIQVIACTNRNALIDMIDRELKKISGSQNFVVIERGIIVKGINSPQAVDASKSALEWGEAHFMISTFPLK
jgi:hypothetical protein